ncbi:MAG: SdrD B-like domain-containing protein, partial [Ghiorsea sp.]|nr:SdrD B-like domain-containing protein [Ghiorsea sp.]
MMQNIRRFGMGLTQRFNNAGLARAVRRVAAAGLFLLFSATAANAAFIPPQVITSSFDFTANGIPVVTSNVTTVTPYASIARTPAVITFLHFNSVTNQYTPADVYHAGNTIYVQVADGDQNTDPYSVQTVTITLTDSVSGDTETLTLTETGPNTGESRGSVGSTRSTAPTPNNNVLSLSVNTLIEATYTDPLDAITTIAAAALVDPFGIFFDSVTGAPIDGVTVTMINSATGLPAQVFGDDGVSVYPSTLVSGGSATDASGSTYNFGSGRYRFPLMFLGTYYLQITPPLGYSFPSQVSDVALQALPTAALESGGQYALLPASRGANFNIVPGPPIKIDFPLDAKGVNLFVQKTTATPTAAIGDRVSYQISVENVHAVTTSSATTISDVLPLGFRYQSGSTTLDGVAVADPTISANGRNLTFNIGTVAPLSAAKLTYTVVIGANAKLGDSTNIAFAAGTLGGIAVQSNVSKATITVREDLIRSKGYIAGVVFVDDNMNELHDEDEKGVQGIRIFMEDGRNVVTDKDGRYHFDGLKLGTHIVQM